MTGARLISELAELKRKAVKSFDASKSAPERWLLRGYIEIIDDAISRTRKSTERALRVYNGLPTIHERCGDIGLEISNK